MKKFYYQVKSYEWEDVEAFGSAWQAAKAKAAELHAPIYRELSKDGDRYKQEVYCTAGCFLRVDLARPQDIKVF